MSIFTLDISSTPGALYARVNICKGRVAIHEPLLYYYRPSLLLSPADLIVHWSELQLLHACFFALANEPNSREPQSLTEAHSNKCYNTPPLLRHWVETTQVTRSVLMLIRRKCLWPFSSRCAWHFLDGNMHPAPYPHDTSISQLTFPQRPTGSSGSILSRPLLLCVSQRPLQTRHQPLRAIPPVCGAYLCTSLDSNDHDFLVV